MYQNALDHNSTDNGKPFISDTETTSLRLEIVDLVKQQLSKDYLKSPDFLDFERDIIIGGVLEGLVKLKNRSETDSSRLISRSMMDIIEKKYDILASKRNKYLKLRDLSWDRVFGIIHEIKVLLKNKPILLSEIELFINKLKEKCPQPYQYYWLLHSKSKDPRASLTNEEQFLLNYLQDYDKAINKNSREIRNHIENQQPNNKFSLKKLFKSLTQS